ncbi:MAG: hypothetical protein WCB57_00350 [Pseudonocardiaceae bacterium]
MQFETASAAGWVTFSLRDQHVGGRDAVLGSGIRAGPVWLAAAQLVLGDESLHLAAVPGRLSGRTRTSTTMIIPAPAHL